MKYLAIKISNGVAIDTTKEISNKTVNFLEQWKKVVDDFDNINSLFQLFISEVAEFNKYMEICSKKKIEDLNADEWFYTTLNRYVINITSNGRLFYEHLSLIIEKQYADFEEELGEIYIFDIPEIELLKMKHNDYDKFNGRPITSLGDVNRVVNTLKEVGIIRKS